MIQDKDNGSKVKAREFTQVSNILAPGSRNRRPGMYPRPEKRFPGTPP
jgi:hypothetical protein